MTSPSLSLARAPASARPGPAGLPIPRISVIICTLDEQEAIGGVLDDVQAALGDVTHEIIVVDDSSNEHTAAVVRARASLAPNIRLIRRKGAVGLASAAIDGWDAARGATLAIMDGDGQHDPQLMRRLLARMDRGGFEVVIASRYLNGGESGLGAMRDLMSRSATLVSGAMLGLRLADPLSGCFIMRREWYEMVRPSLSGLGFKILIDVVASARRKPTICQISTALRPRAGGASKLDFRVIFDLAALLIDKRTRGVVPARMSQFLLVGLTGLALHLLVLAAAKLTGAHFWLAQGLAILTAMTWNFALNNSLTFRDRRLRGSAAWRGLLSFYGACLGGAVVSEASAAAVHAFGGAWALAGVFGALLGAFWNYGAARRLTWKLTDQPHRQAAVAVLSWLKGLRR